MPRNQWSSEGATGHLPPFGPSAIQQAKALKCTHQVDQGKNTNHGRSYYRALGTQALPVFLRLQ